MLYQITAHPPTGDCAVYAAGRKFYSAAPTIVELTEEEAALINAESRLESQALAEPEVGAVKDTITPEPEPEPAPLYISKKLKRTKKH